MKLKIVLLALIGAAGATSSFALADSGHHGRGHTRTERRIRHAREPWSSEPLPRRSRSP